MNCPDELAVYKVRIATFIPLPLPLSRPFFLILVDNCVNLLKLSSPVGTAKSHLLIVPSLVVEINPLVEHRAIDRLPFTILLILKFIALLWRRCFLVFLLILLLHLIQ
jgi:hypothetical protein